MLFHRLELELEFFQVGFQLLDLFGFSKKLALETAVSAAAITTAVTRSVFVFRLSIHIISPIVRLIKRFFRLISEGLLKPNEYLALLGKSSNTDQFIIYHQAGIDEHRGNFLDLGDITHLGDIDQEARIFSA
jgi:hypothetical protein